MNNTEKVLEENVTLRPRRQLTLPASVCEVLGIKPGDQLELSVTEDGLLVRPKKTLALKALEEIQRAFANSGISEKELQEEGRKVRERLSKVGRIA